MNKNVFFKIFTLLFLILSFVLPSIAVDKTVSGISKIVVDPLENNKYTLNLFFENSYKGKAFLQKIQNGYYYVYLPDTTLNKKKIKTIYKNKYDKKNITINADEKNFLNNKNTNTNYVRIIVNMNSDYSLRLLSKDIKDYNFLSDISFSSINIFSLIILVFGVIVFLLFKKLTNILKTANSLSYTAFPENFHVRKPSYNKNLKSVKKPKYRRSGLISGISLKNRLKAADKKSFDCFNLSSQNLTEYNKYDFKSAIKETSNLLRTNPKANKVKHTNPISNAYNEALELDLPSVEDKVKEEQQHEKKAELLSVLNITNDKGFYLTTVGEKIALFGFIGEKVFLLKEFNDLSQINLQARFYDKNGDSDVYIVRLDDYKSMVEISDNSIRELAVL